MVLLDKGESRWEFQAEAGRDPKTGKRRRRSLTFQGTKRQAERAHALFLANVAQEPTAARATVGDILTLWLEQAELSPTTRREYSRLVEVRIRPALGKVPLKMLDAGQLDRFYRALLADLKPASIRQVHAIIRRALAQAVKWGWVRHNVAANATPPRVRTTKPRPPTGRAVVALIGAAERKSSELGLAVHLAAATGARRGELCAIRWSDVDLTAGTIRIARSVYQAGRERGEKDTKTHAERVVDVGESTVEALKHRWEEQQERIALGGLGHSQGATPHACRTGLLPTAKLSPHAFVLSSSVDGTEPMHPDRLTGAWRRLPGTKGIRLHDLRHWSVSEALDQGHNVVAVAERHGHKDPHVTLAVYGHTTDGRGKKIAAGIDDVLAGERRARAIGPPRGT